MHSTFIAAPHVLIHPKQWYGTYQQRKGKHQIRKYAINQHQLCGVRMTSNPDKGGILDDFDRDYYDELKREYADMKNVHILSKEDYEIDPTTAPYLLDFRGRDLENVRENMKKREEAGDTPKEFPGPVMHVTDFHTSEEKNEFEERLRSADVISGRVWEDPMPESDFDLDPNWIDLRKIPDDKLKNSGINDDQFFQDFQDFPSQPMLRKKYSSEAEEIEDIHMIMERMKMEELEYEFESNGYGSSIDPPDSEDFAKWQAEAEKRGGNSTEHESYFLSPFQKKGKASTKQNCDSTSDKYKEEKLEYPDQYDSLIRVHRESWEGRLCAFSLFDEGRLNPRSVTSVPVRSEMQTRNGTLHWNTTADFDGLELESTVKFSSTECENVLVPGRGVSECGSYISIAHSHDEQLKLKYGISVSEKFISKLLPETNPVIEFCVVLRGSLERYRIILCSKPVGNTRKDKKNRNKDKITEVIFISESRNDQKRARRTSKTTNSRIRMTKVLGKWHGKGLILHPSFPKQPFRRVETVLNIRKNLNISEEEVTWVEKIPSDRPEMQTSTKFVRNPGRKPSKRVLAVKMHDQRRVSKCSILSTSNSGMGMEMETYPWQAEPTEANPSFFFSPRLGKFVYDYCSVPLFGKFLLTFPVETSCPDMWHTISVTELNTPSRKRLVAGCNELGHLVGTFFISEMRSDDNASDEICGYV